MVLEVEPEARTNKHIVPIDSWPQPIELVNGDKLDCFVVCWIPEVKMQFIVPRGYKSVPQSTNVLDAFRQHHVGADDDRTRLDLVIEGLNCNLTVEEVVAKHLRCQ